jgi:hypothetical protein
MTPLKSTLATGNRKAPVIAKEGFANFVKLALENTAIKDVHSRTL